jgi:ABC-type Na+ transport system ATPase subunit NatA
MKNIKNNTIVIVLIAAIVAGTAGFFGGMQYQRSQRGSFARQFGAGQGMMGANGANRGGGFRPVAGEILSSDKNSVTVKMTDGSSKIVVFTDKTTINKTATASASDLKVKEQVVVFGNENADGTVTAQSVQIGGNMRNRSL